MTFKEKLERAFEEKYSSCTGIFYNTMRSVALWAASFALSEAENLIEKSIVEENCAYTGRYLSCTKTPTELVQEIREMKESLNDPT